MNPARAGDRALVIAAGVATVAWVSAAVLTAGRGLDLSDEGFYLLSYRWWDSTPRTFTGAPYLYGPVYDALGHDVRDLRLVRLVTVLGAHLLLARSVLLWLRARAVPSVSPAAGAATVLASGGVVYGWLPLSPGYNDVSALGAVILGATVLRAHAAGRSATSLPWSWAASAGVVAAAMLLAKWSSAVLVVGLASLTVALLGAERPRRLVRSGAVFGLAALGAFALVHLLVVRLDEAVPPWWETTTLVAAGSNSPLSLVEMYARTSLPLAPALVAALAGLLLHGWTRRQGGVIAVTGAIIAVVAPLTAVLVLARGLRGGVDGTTGYTSLLVVGAVLGIGAVVLARPTTQGVGRGGLLVVTCLLVLPAAQAFGTGNPLFQMAVNAGALSVAATLLALSHLALPSDRWLSGLVALSTSVGLGWVAVDASVVRPYRTETFPAPSHVETVATGSLRLPRATAAEVTALREALDAQDNVGRPYLGFDELAGVVLLLDGRSVGEAWYSGVDRSRTATGIESDCVTLTSHPAGPALLFARPPGEEEIGALASCGLDFPDGFRLVRVPDGPPGLAVYVPVDE